MSDRRPYPGLTEFTSWSGVQKKRFPMVLMKPKTFAAQPMTPSVACLGHLAAGTRTYMPTTFEQSDLSKGGSGGDGNCQP